MCCMVARFLLLLHNSLKQVPISRKMTSKNLLFV